MDSDHATPAAAQDAAGSGAERRLHPLSWLFVLLEQLRHFALPLAALLLFGGSRDDRWQWYGLVGVAMLTLLAVVRYFTYRFRIAPGELVVRSGILHRNVRHIPFGRIHNVALRRNLLHRAFGVAEVRLESAGSQQAEAQMRVLSLADAQALEALVRGHAVAAPAVGATQAVPAQDELLLALTPLEVIKLGLTSNRGLLLGAAGAGALSQGAEGFAGWLVASLRDMSGGDGVLGLGGTSLLLVALSLFALLALLLRLLSVAIALAQYHGFELRQSGSRLSVERGLLTRLRSHTPLGRIQHWTLRESLVHRWLGRRSLDVETAVMQVDAEARAIPSLAPIAPPGQIDALLSRWLPWLQLDRLDWQPLHPGAWRRIAFWPVLLTLLATVPLCWRFGSAGLALLVLLPWWVFRARRVAANSYWAVSDRVLAWRSGWLDRRLSFAEIGKLQGLELSQSPFDRRRGMASLFADTAGATPFGHRLHLRYLPVEAAVALQRRVGAAIARSRLRW